MGNDRCPLIGATERENPGSSGGESMKDQMRYAVSLLVGLLIIGTLCAGEVGPDNPTWEYAVYEVRQVYNEKWDLQWEHFYWYSKGATTVANRRVGVREVSAGKKYELFNRLGAQNSQIEHHDLLLWNHMGSQGWEYTEQFQQHVGRAVHTQTVFRRRVDS